MEKVDVAIQSYKKPESLIYTLLCLKKYCGNHIDTVYINDDLSGEETIKFYTDENFIKAMFPIKIKLRINKYHFKPGVVQTTLPKYIFPLSLSDLHSLYKGLKQGFFIPENDIRYQWAINTTDKSKLLILHDDVKINSDVVALYLECFNSNSKLIISGQLGQCNICRHSQKGCIPAGIMKGIYPSKIWPKTISITDNKQKYICRINEWCCMIDVSKTKKIKSHFGAFYRGADTAAYWFNEAVKKGYEFVDPFAEKNNHIEYFEHCWQGYAGHSVWIAKDKGLDIYNKNMINDALLSDFGYKISKSKT